MQILTLGRSISLGLAVVVAGGCDKKEAPVAEAPSATASAKTAEAPAPKGCQASGKKPVKLGETFGYVYGFAGDATDLFFSSWQLYGSRGDVGKIRKDGGGKTQLTSLDLEPRGLAVDDKLLYFTAGIRLNTIPKAGGETDTPAPTFSSQAIALDGAHVYGVPGDYGPYDRVVKMTKKDRKSKELGSVSRPEAKHGPFGYSAIVVDGSGVYVTDSSGNRVLRFSLKGGKPKSLAKKQAKPYSLAMGSDDVYFNLALKGDLMRVPKKGGAASKIASGLVVRAVVAADENLVYTVFKGPKEGDPQILSGVDPKDGTLYPLATAPSANSIEAMTLDKDCVYWAERDADTKNSTIFARSRE